MACTAHLTGAELNGEGVRVRGYFIQAERRSITVAVKCRVAAVTTCINSSCCDRMGFFSFSIRRLKYNINLPVLLPSALCNCLAAPSLLMDFLSNTSSSSISEKQPLLLNKPSSVTLCSPPLRPPLSACSSFCESCLSDIFPPFGKVKETAQTKIKVFLLQPLIRAEWEVRVWGGGYYTLPVHIFNTETCFCVFY